MSPQSNREHKPRRGSVVSAPDDVADAGFQHRPVMVAEVLEVFSEVPSGVVVDATLGAGGHARAILATLAHLSLIGIDQDSDAVAAATTTLAEFGPRATVVHSRFDRLAEVVAGHAHGAPVVGVLFDLGVSSPQLDQAERGFSYRRAAPLDMRMDRSGPTTAADLVNQSSELELARLFVAHGEQRFARRIASAIVTARPLHTTTELAEVVANSVPAAVRRRGHPAKRVFQALRVAVNQELEVLPGSIDAAIEVATPSGRVVVISYHSGEDRAVKERFLQAATGGCTCPPGLPCVCGAVPRARLLNRGARKPAPAEVAANPRSESARFRAVEILASTSSPSASVDIGNERRPL